MPVHVYDVRSRDGRPLREAVASAISTDTSLSVHVREIENPFAAATERALEMSIVSVLVTAEGLTITGLLIDTGEYGQIVVGEEARLSVVR